MEPRLKLPELLSGISRLRRKLQDRLTLLTSSEQVLELVEVVDKLRHVIDHAAVPGIIVCLEEQGYETGRLRGAWRQARDGGAGVFFLTTPTLAELVIAACEGRRAFFDVRERQQGTHPQGRDAHLHGPVRDSEDADIDSLEKELAVRILGQAKEPDWRGRLLDKLKFLKESEGRPQYLLILKGGGGDGPSGFESRPNEPCPSDDDDDLATRIAARFKGQLLVFVLRGGDDPFENTFVFTWDGFPRH
jgi:hypothetical protein